MSLLTKNLTRWTMEERDFEVFSFSECYKDSTPVHFHVDFYEAYFFRSGDVIYNVNMEQYHLSPGDMLLIPPNVMHWPLIQDSTQLYRRMFLWINERYLKSISTTETELSSCFNTGHHGYVFHPTTPKMTEITMLIEQLIEIENTQPYGYDILRSTLFTLVMLKINEASLDLEMTKKPMQLQSKRINQVTHYINAHLSESTLSLDELSRVFYVSKSTLAKTFSKQMGVTLQQYIIKRRMYLAYQLLSDGEFPSKTSTLVGYNDYSAFYRAFCKEFGSNPKSLWRENPEP